MSKINLSLNSRFKLGFVVNTSFMILELIMGVLSGSLVLVADATHNLTDSITLIVSWVANIVGTKPADSTHTLGHGRVTVLGALINSTILIATAVLILTQAYQRFLHPSAINGLIIAQVAFVGIAANGFVAFLFRKDRKDLNVRAAYVNMAFDVLISIATFAAGICIALTHGYWIDPLVSLLVGFGLLYAAFDILRQTSVIFLEGVPDGIDVKTVRKIIKSHTGVSKLHSLYIWGITNNDYVACCNVSTNHESYGQNKLLKDNIRKNLKKLGFSLVIIEIT